MAYVPERVADLLAPDADAFSALAISDDAGERLRSDLGALDQATLEGFMISDLLRSLYRALDLPLADILRSAWSSMVELQEYRDSAKHPPGEANRVRFGKHKVTSKHRPKLVVLVNEKEVGEIVFDIQLTLHITGTTLLVRDGRIWQAMGSEFEGECELSYCGLRLAHKKVGLFTIPGGIDIENGLPIPPLGMAGESRKDASGATAWSQPEPLGASSS